MENLELKIFLRFSFYFNWRTIALQCKNILLETKKFTLRFNSYWIQQNTIRKIEYRIVEIIKTKAQREKILRNIKQLL